MLRNVVNENNGLGTVRVVLQLVRNVLPSIYLAGIILVRNSGRMIRLLLNINVLEWQNELSSVRSRPGNSPASSGSLVSSSIKIAS